MTSAMSTNPGPGGPGPEPSSLAGRALASRLVMTPARRSAILIGVPIVFLIFITGGYSIVSNTATGSFPVSKSIDIVGGKLTMNLGGGNATLSGSDTVSATARLAGTVHYHIKAPTLRTSEGNISLDCPVVDTGNCTLDATIDVPAGVALALSTGGGDLSASDLSSGGTLSTGGGNITLNGSTGDLALTSDGGNVHASDVGGQTVTISANGGNVGGSAITASHLTVGSGGGDVTLTLTSSPHDLQVASDGGNVTIVVPRGQYIVNANADGGSLNPGDISSARNATDVISVTSGGGNISVTQAAS